MHTVGQVQMARPRPFSVLVIAALLLLMGVVVTSASELSYVCVSIPTECYEAAGCSAIGLPKSLATPLLPANTLPVSADALPSGNGKLEAFGLMKFTKVCSTFCYVVECLPANLLLNMLPFAHHSLSKPTTMYNMYKHLTMC
jgi:hypothetical protein